MSWGAVAGAAIGVVGGALANKGKDKNGGAGTSTATKEPWAEAAPWLKDLLGQGQTLYGQYSASPFSERQNAAYNNQYALSDAFRGLAPSLLGQLSDQPLGFDPKNPTNKAKAFDWTSLFGGTGGTGAGIGGGTGLAGLSATPAALPAADPRSWTWDGKFHNQDEMLTGQNVMADGLGAGGFGSFRYGQAAPEIGSDAYRDMSEYFLRGGLDTNNMYGRAPGANGRVGVNLMDGYTFPAAAGGA